MSRLFVCFSPTKLHLDGLSTLLTSTAAKIGLTEVRNVSFCKQNPLAPFPEEVRILIFFLGF